MLDLSHDPHRRYNPLTREWVLVSPHRTKRPWQGKVERPPETVMAPYDPRCYLCPGNQRAGGHINPPYTGIFVFDNDFAALLPGTSTEQLHEDELLLAVGEPGICRVICFSPRHDLTLARMDLPGIRAVIETWREQYRELGAYPFIRHVQIFENRGEIMGCSNPHPHCQIWANSSLPNQVAVEAATQREYFERHRRTLLEDYSRVELRRGERIVLGDDHFLVVVPFWAIWPFETMVISLRPVASLLDLTAEEVESLAVIFKRLTTRYDNLFETDFPYSMGIHQQPTDGESNPGFHFHIHFYPPLLRSATVKKFMVGYELLALPQRDITPESAAERLRQLPERHYREVES